MAVFRRKEETLHVQMYYDHKRFYIFFDARTIIALGHVTFANCHDTICTNLSRSEYFSALPAYFYPLAPCSNIRERKAVSDDEQTYSNIRSSLILIFLVVLCIK